jgi:hypothetical protein
LRCIPEDFAASENFRTGLDLPLASAGRPALR